MPWLNGNPTYKPLRGEPRLEPVDDEPDYFDVALSDDANGIYKKLVAPFDLKCEREINETYRRERDVIDDVGIAHDWYDEQSDFAERLGWKLPLLAAWNY